MSRWAPQQAGSGSPRQLPLADGTCPTPCSSPPAGKGSSRCRASPPPGELRQPSQWVLYQTAARARCCSADVAHPPPPCAAITHLLPSAPHQRRPWLVRTGNPLQQLGGAAAPMGGQQAGVSSRPTAVAGAASRPAAPPMARFPFSQAQGSSQNVSQPPPRFPPSQAQGSSLNQVGGMVAGMGLRGRRHR